MDEFTDNQLELVEQAMLESSFGNGSAKDVMAKLRKKPERFRAGEVGWSTLIGEYLAAPKEEMHLYQGCRPLHLSEQSQALEDFVKGVVKAKSDIEEWLKSEDDSLNIYEIFKALSALEIPR